MAMRLISATGQPLAALALLAGLCACATTAATPSVETPPPGWRIVERTGEARYLPPDNAAWVAATTGQALAGGSEIATGVGGRLIVDAPGRHLSVGPDSRFVLPGQDTWLEQRAGWLRYRIAAAAQPFRIHTRSLELEVSSGVVDVHVNHLATEVTVKEGQVRVATPDGLRQTQMLAGQSARAGDVGIALAVRLAPGQALQPIEPVVLPALQPKPAPPGMAAATAPEAPPTAIPPAPSTSAPAAAASVRAGAEPLVLRQPTAPATMGPQPLANDPAAATARLGHGANPALRATRVESAGGRPAGADGSVGAIATASRPADPAAIRRSKFERLTAGVLDGIQPPQPARLEPGPIR
jgi:hypothetical protein